MRSQGLVDPGDRLAERVGLVRQREIPAEMQDATAVDAGDQGAGEATGLIVVSPEPADDLAVDDPGELHALGHVGGLGRHIARAAVVVDRHPHIGIGDGEVEGPPDQGRDPIAG